MIIMDLNGATWVGNLYGKFEAMCLEVEEHMRQDTLNYVENQVQTVGESVKRFYSDVMQDLSPSSVDLMKPQKVGANVKLLCSDVAQDLSPEQKNHIGIRKLPKTGLKGEVSKANIQKPTRVSDSAKEKCPYLNPKKANDNGMCRQPNFGIESETLELVNPLLRDSIPVPNQEVAVDQMHMLSPVEIRECASEDGINCTDEDKICLLETAVGKGAGSSLTSRLSEEKNGSSEDITECDGSEDTFIPHPGRLEDRDSATPEHGKETLEPPDELEVDETCVIVDATKSCLFSQRDVKHRSYKKKIREAFSAKKKSARKQEYEQLAINYGGIAEGSNQNCTADSTPNLAIQPRGEKLLGQDSSESEWEIL